MAPWTVLDRKITCADPRLRVRSDLCLTPAGEVVGPAHVIEGPNRVAIVALAPGGSKILLARRYRHGVAAIMSGLPGGLVDRAGGTPHLAAAEIAAGRELFEAAGYAAKHWTCLFKGHPDSAGQTSTAYCFLATGLARLPVPPAIPTEAAAEIIECDFLTALKLVQHGRLPVDVLDAAALWSAASHIAADRSGWFGRLSVQLRRFFAGSDDLPGEDPFAPAAFPGAEVGG